MVDGNILRIQLEAPHICLSVSIELKKCVVHCLTAYILSISLRSGLAESLDLCLLSTPSLHPFTLMSPTTPSFCILFHLQPRSTALLSAPSKQVAVVGLLVCITYVSKTSYFMHYRCERQV